MSNDEMSNIQSGNGKGRTTDRNSFDPKQIKLALRKVREESEGKKKARFEARPYSQIGI